MMKYVDDIYIYDGTVILTGSVPYNEEKVTQEKYI